MPDPDGSPTATRNQVAGSTAFNGGEGAWYSAGKVWFTTKGDNRVWELDVRATPVLTGDDNIFGSASGDLFVAEDPGNLELVLIEPSGATSPFLRVLNQSGSERPVRHSTRPGPGCTSVRSEARPAAVPASPMR